MNTHAIRALLGLTAIGLAGCVAGPDFQSPLATDPAGATLPAAADVEIPAHWWKLFMNETLDARVGEALTNSPSLAQAVTRLRRAQEEYNAQAGAGRCPAVAAGISAARQKVNPAAMGMSEIPIPAPFNLFNATVNVAYSFDLFGRNRRVLESLQAQVDRKEYEREAARQTLVANVVLASIRLAEAEEHLATAREVVSARQAQMEIARDRKDAGGISARELEAQGLALEQARAALPSAEEQVARLRRQLAVYLGQEPGAAEFEALALNDLHVPESVPASVPSAIARQRLDIRAAEAVWHQACANVGVAAADLYPQITLTGSLGSQTTDLGDMLEKMNVWSVGAGLMQPVFQGGALRARKRAAMAAYDEAAAAYRETVLRGLQEVADVLGALAADARILAARADGAEHARLAAGIAKQQVEQGGLSQVAMQEDRIRHLQAESERVAAQAAQLADTAALFHALGGGWWNCAENQPE